jgi:hypothetical protein
MEKGTLVFAQATRSEFGGCGRYRERTDREPTYEDRVSMPVPRDALLPAECER